MALALGSLWVFIPVVPVCLLLVVRTAREDHTVREEVAGDREYAQTIRRSVSSWVPMTKPIRIPDMTKTLPCFSFPAPDETMAQLSTR